MIRFLDFILSVMGSIVLLPVFILISAFVLYDSRGSLIFRQIRVGKDGVDFKLFKFRTMKTGSDKKGQLTVGEKDSRITRSGYLLRKYKLDELPQLLNVLKGEMSFVGPRPEVRKYVDLYDDEQKKILSVRPGITDIASIEYRNENEMLKQYKDPEKAYIEIIMPHKILLNMQYIENYNLKNYLRIILLTLQNIFK
jgi:lipopolysaccharide/colanic/teichoic acid biosynthesis glycosyltransferase